jgi:alanine racemase
MYRQTYVKINCDTLKKNIEEIKSKYKYKYYIGIVKANAYGHGDYIINSLIEGGINYLAASSLEECLNIRKRNKNIKILCLEPIDHEFLDIASDNNITITVPDYEYLKKIKINNHLDIHLKIDSGMNRLGTKDKYEVKLIYDKIKEKNNLTLEGIYTHFATSGIWDKHWDNQLENFKKATSLIDLQTIPIIHLGRSLTLVNHPKIEFANAIRLGIIMYGFSQSLPNPTGLRLIKRKMILKIKKISPTTLTNNLQLNTAFTLHSKVISTKDITKGEFVGYGAQYIADKLTKIAIIPIGFADGIQKNMTGKNVTIKNKKYPVIGQIGMDMITVKIDKNIKIGDEVIIYDNIKKCSKELGLSAYQLFTSITTRVPRVYIENGKKTEIKY